jgi:Holliday junction DNA helicase RuvA
VRKSLPEVVVEAGGVGYELSVSLVTFEALPREGSEAKLDVLTLFRADSLQLFGFASSEEKAIFRTLLGVNGVGPRLALSILSTLEPSLVRQAARDEDTAPFERVPGIGKKTARRLVLELRDRLEESAAALPSAPQAGAPGTAADAQMLSDAVAALETLGTKRSEAQAAARAAQSELGDSAELAALIRAALRRLGTP